MSSVDNTRNFNIVIPNDDLSKVIFSRKNLIYINLSAKKRIKELIGRDVGDLNKIDLYRHIQNIYSNLLPYFYQGTMVNKTLNYRIKYFNDIIIEDIVSSMLQTIKEIFHGIQYRYRKSIRPYDIYKSITTPDKCITIPVGDDFKGGFTSGIGHFHDRRNMQSLDQRKKFQREQNLIYSIDPSLGRSFTAKKNYRVNTNR